MIYKISKSIFITVLMIVSIFGNMTAAENENGSWEIFQSDYSDFVWAIGYNDVIAQSFITPANAETINEIQFFFMTDYYDSGYIRVGISNYLTTNPNNWLVFVERDAGDYYLDPDWHTFDGFDIDIDHSSQYYIMFKLYGTPGGDYIKIQGSTTNPYPDGKVYANQGSGWEWENDWDWGFFVGGDVINQPPEIPERPNGPEEGYIDISYSYSTSTTDPDDDQVKYGWNWDDGTSVEWTGYYSSGANCERSHSWENPGTYHVKVIAEDEHGLQSDEWSPARTVTITEPEQPELSYSPSTIHFGTHDQGWTGSDTFEIWNSGTGTLTYSFSEGLSWITSINPSSGSSTGEHDTITVNVGNTGSMSGYYSGYIQISSNDVPGSIFVDITINEPVDPPSVTTLDPYNGIGYATLYGNLNSMGGADSCQVWFVWDTSSHTSWQDYDHGTSHQIKYSPGEFSDTVTPDAGTYHFRAVASNSGGTSQGVDRIFIVIPLPSMALDPNPLDFGNVLEGQIVSDTFEIWNDGGGVLSYDFSWDDWISDVSPPSGSSSGEHDLITVHIDTTGLSLGPHISDISIELGGPFPYEYPVMVNIVSSVPPPDTVLYDANIEHVHKDCTILAVPTIPIPLDSVLDRWPEIPDDISSADYGYYGHDIDLYIDYARSALKAEYGFPVLPVPISMQVNQLIGITYEVPIATGPGTEHNARISFQGDYEGEIWIEDIGFATVNVDIIVEEGTTPSWPFIPLGGSKEVREYEVGAFLSQDDWVFSDSLSHEDAYIDVRLEEGESYMFWVVLRPHLTLEGWEIFGFEGKGWSDIEFMLDEVKIDYHNPPVPPPPGEHYPETPTIDGPSNIMPGESEIFFANATDLDGDNLYYKWYWGDGETTDWLGPYPSGEIVSIDHFYDYAGVYYARVQVKDDSDYELQSDLSFPLQVNVSGYDGSIAIDSPVGGEQWPVGTEQIISWTWDGYVGDYVMIALYKESGPDDFDFYAYLTEEPISTFVGSYDWGIDIGQETGTYCIVIFNEANASVSNPVEILNHPPVLSNYPGWPDGVDPDWGTSDTDFTFKVHYYDEDGHEPAVKDVIIDDVHYEMIGSGSDSHYTLTLLGSEVGGGTHDYYFYFEDPPGDSDILPDTGSWQFTVNLPPNKPLQPAGPTSGVTGTEYTYESITTDPEEENIAYWFDWGDDTNSGWTSFVPSGTQGSASKIWTSPGEYEVKVKARDIHGNESEWSDSLLVTIYSENNAPNQPSNPYPADGQRRLGRYVTLAWDGGDPDSNDTVTYEIYFGVLPNPPLKYTIQCPATQERMEYEVGPLMRETRYYWKIKAIDDHDATTEGPTWWFKTRLILVQSCFLVGTQITMVDGSYKNIEDIVVGDMVRSYDTINNREIPGIVTKTYHHESSEMSDYYVVINNELRVTPNHCLYQNGRWIPAGSVKVGDVVNTSLATVTSTEKVFEQVPTYDLEVQPIIMGTIGAGGNIFFYSQGFVKETEDTGYLQGLPYFVEDDYLVNKVPTSLNVLEHSHDLIQR